MNLSDEIFNPSTLPPTLPPIHPPPIYLVLPVLRSDIIVLRISHVGRVEEQLLLLGAEGPPNRPDGSHRIDAEGGGSWTADRETTGNGGRLVWEGGRRYRSPRNSGSVHFEAIKTIPRIKTEQTRKDQLRGRIQCPIKTVHSAWNDPVSNFPVEAIQDTPQVCSEVSLEPPIEYLNSKAKRFVGRQLCLHFPTIKTDFDEDTKKVENGAKTPGTENILSHKRLTNFMTSPKSSPCDRNSR